MRNRQKLIETAEKFTAGTIARGVLWAIAAISAKVGVEAPDEDISIKLGAWAAAVVFALAAYLWSRVKDRIWKDLPPGQR